MKINKQTVTETEVEISLPYFLKSDTGTYVAILSETQSIVVREKSIETPKYNGQNFVEDSTHIEITAEEFTRRFDRVVEGIQSFKSQFFNQAI